MKSLLIAVSILGLNLSAYSQVYKFKAFQTYWRSAEQTRPTAEYDWQKVDFLVVINLDKSKIKTFGEKEGDMDLIRLKEVYKNSNGDNVIPYEGVDGDGDKCEIEITIFKDQSGLHTATLRVGYPGGSMLFRLKKDE